MMMILMMMMMMRLLYYFPSLPALCLRLCALNAPVKFNYNSVHRCDYSQLLSAQRADFPLPVFVLGLSIGAWQNLVALVIGA